jgi:DNA-binding LytR/AlgR family response regulator
MKILVAEDDVLVSTKLCNALKNRGYHVIGPARKGAEAIVHLNETEPDIAILDWDLADNVNGLEVAQVLKSKFNIPIIFVTGRLEEHVRQLAIAQNAFAFINKPFNERNVMNAIDLAVSQYAIKNNELEEPIPSAQESAHLINDKLFVKKNGAYEKMPIGEIFFIEAGGNYATLHTKDGQVLASSRLSALLEQINNPALLRVHRSFAVNMNNLEKFDDSFVYFSEKAIPLSKSYKAEFLNQLKLL